MRCNFGPAAALSPAVALALTAAVAHGQCVAPELDKLLPVDAAPADRFGYSIAIDDLTMLVGTAAADSGYVQVYLRAETGWHPGDVLRPPSPSAGFGYSVALEGDVAVIGDLVWAGRAYVFRRDGTGLWMEETKLAASDGEEGDQFGVSAAISGSAVIVGARQSDPGDEVNAGAAYVYRYDEEARTWLEEAKLVASDAASADDFGRRVAIDGDVVLVGAHGNDDAGASSGSAYVFRRDATTGGWVEEAKLTAPDAAERDVFGVAVAVQGDTAAVGAPATDGPATDSGVVWIFGRDRRAGTWRVAAALQGSDAASAVSPGFGLAIALAGDTLVATAPDGLEPATYVFERVEDRWIQRTKAVPWIDDVEPTAFGLQFVAIGTGELATGAHKDDEAAENAGAVYVLPLACDPCAQADITGDGAVDGSDLAELLVAWGEVECPTPPDLDGDCTVGFDDLLVLLSAWGRCP